MEKIGDGSCLIVRFSFLWEILPFYGHFPLWRYLMLNANTRTKSLWIKNESAFKELAKGMKMNVLKYEKPFDNEFK